MKNFGNRRTIRLQKYDYSDPGWYFVTVCTQNRECLFGIIIIRNQNMFVGAGLVPALDYPTHINKRATTRVAPTMGDIVGAFKSETTHEYIMNIKNNNWPSFNKRLWQRNYYEHIIRTEYELNRIRKYIKDNPQNWDEDRNNLF